jgi:hypothetical protein
MPAPNDNLSDPEIAQAYEDVRSDKSETTWLVLKYESATKDNLKLATTGKGDIAEMAESLGDDEAAYAYVRMTLGNDEYSERTKFVFIVWAGKYCIPNVSRAEPEYNASIFFFQMLLISSDSFDGRIGNPGRKAVLLICPCF